MHLVENTSLLEKTRLIPVVTAIRAKKALNRNDIKYIANILNFPAEEKRILQKLAHPLKTSVIFELDVPNLNLLTSGNAAEVLVKLDTVIFPDTKLYFKKYKCRFYSCFGNISRGYSEDNFNAVINEKYHFMLNFRNYNLIKDFHVNQETTSIFLEIEDISLTAEILKPYLNVSSE